MSSNSPSSTDEPSLTPRDDARAAPPGGSPPRRRRALKAAMWLSVVLLCLFVAVAAALFLAVHTESGTRTAWQLATRVLGGRLAGRFEGGRLQTGLRLSNVTWQDGGTTIKIDRLDGQWRVSRKPWRLTVDWLHAGTVDARLSSAPASTSKMALPQRLTLPVQIALRDLAVKQLLIRDGASTTVYRRLALHGETDGVSHQLTLDSLDTPAGELAGHLVLKGVRPFAVQADLGFSGDVASEAAQASASASGSLERLLVDVQASGLKLSATAHVVATPFGAVPLERASVSADHLNPQVLSPGAPRADLSLRASLQPVTNAKSFTVTGSVAIVNALPGRLDAQRLPLLDAQANIRLDARTQIVDDLRVRLLGDGKLTGNAAFADAHGRITLQVAGLDLHALHDSVRTTNFAGPLNATLDASGQRARFDLKDARAALGLSGAIDATSQRTAWQDLKLTSGKGTAQLNGELRRDAAASYTTKVVLKDFDPLTLTAACCNGGSAKAAPGARGKTAHSPAGAPRRQAAASRNTKRGRPINARVSGTLTANGTLSPQLGANIVFALGDSMYDGLPMTGHGTVHWLGTRLLPSQAALSVAGNDVKLDGSFGAPRDRLRFDINAQRLDRLGFGLAGTLLANGNVSGSLAHPDVAAHYRAENLAFGDNRVAAASGELELRDGVMGVTHLVADASGVSAPGLALDTLSARVDGTRSNHSINLAARGTLRERPIDVSLAARGALAQTGNALSWNGTVSQLANRGVPQLQLDSPLTVSAGPQHLVLGATQLSVEGATLVLSRFAFDHGRIASAGAATNIDVQRMLNVEKALTGERPALVTDLVIDGKWDFDLSGGPATGYLQLQRRSGDVTVDAGNGPLPLGISQLLARAELTGGNRADLTVNAKATRLGSLDADLHTPLTRRDGFPALADEAPLSGHISADLPSLRIAGGLLGPAYLLDGRMALRLTVAGQLARPKASGMLTGDNIAATLVDEGVQFKHGVVRVAVTENRLDFQQVEFHGGDGVLRATGRVQLDGSDPDLSAKIVADKFELFATPDRQLSLSGQANVGSAGPQGGMTIGGKFTVDRALFDLPNSAAPQLGDDVVLVRSGGAEVAAEPLPVTSASEKPEGRFAPRTNITIDLGQHFRFRGQGADLGLTGSLAVTSAPREPLRAVGDVRVTPGSTYEAFGRKLGIESGYFTFNGPVDNPGINITAMRRNLEVEAGVRVSGTVKAPDARLISEPNVPDQDKLSWLLFGHGSDTGTNTAQQGTLNAAIGLLGNAGGKRLAQTFGLDEVTVGQSEVGLSDPQVVSVAKAVSERFVLGYEQGLTKAESVFKLTWQISRSWSIAAHGGAANGVDLLFNRRFD